MSLIGREFLGFALNVVNPGHLFQRTLRNLALVTGMQIKELAPRVRQTTHLRDALAHQLLVAAEVIAHQVAPPVTQKHLGVLTGAGLAEVIHHGFGIFKGPCGIGPQICPLGLAIAGLEHLHRRFVRVHHAVAQNVSFERVHQRLQLYAAATHPGAQGGARYGQPGAAKDGLLAIQRQVIGKLGHQHLGQ